MDTGTILSLVFGILTVVGTLLATTAKVVSLLGDLKVQLASVAAKVAHVESECRRIERDVLVVREGLEDHRNRISAVNERLTTLEAGE